MADLVLAMSAGKEQPEARLMLVYGRMQDRLHMDAAPEQRLGQADTMHAVADDHGHDGVALSGAGRQTMLPCHLEEELAALTQSLDPFRLGLHHAERRHRGGGIGGRL